MKKYTVDLGTYTGGRFESFMSKKEALNFIKENKGYPFINLKNNWKDISIRVKNDPDGKRGDENCNHHWIGIFGQVFCDKCNAVQKIACNHTGSVGCTECAKEYANELNDPKSRLNKEYHKWKKEGDFCQICGTELDRGICKNEYCYILR